MLNLACFQVLDLKKPMQQKTLCPILVPLHRSGIWMKDCLREAGLSNVEQFYSAFTMASGWVGYAN